VDRFIRRLNGVDKALAGARGSKEPLVCIIAGRNLGDIVIASTFVKGLIARGYAERYLLWTRPHMQFLFEDAPGCEVIESPFPVGTAKRFDFAGARRFLAAARQIRGRGVSVSVDLIGDVRERWFARLAGSPRHLHIGWAKGHPFHGLIRNPFGVGRPVITVPTAVPNIYAGYQLLLDELAPPQEATAGMLAGYSGRSAPGPFRVGLHPFASVPSKFWPDSNWRELAARLLDRGTQLVVFAAPDERARLDRLFGALSGQMTVLAAGIKEFTRTVATLDLMVGLDSFAVHVAKLQGVQSITINAGNPAELWAVPGGETLAKSGGCAHYPCFNRAPCSGTSAGNVCVRSITVAEVSEAIETARSRCRVRQAVSAQG
jgi:lipopolysaccharide heptosyltransferase III